MRRFVFYGNMGKLLNYVVLSFKIIDRHGMWMWWVVIRGRQRFFNYEMLFIISREIYYCMVWVKGSGRQRSRPAAAQRAIT